MVPSEKQIQVILHQILYLPSLKTQLSLLAWLKPSYRRLSRALSAHPSDQPHGERMIYEQTTGNSSGSPKGNTIPSTPSGSSEVPIIPSSASGSTSGKFGEPPLNVPRGENFNSDPVVTADGFALSNAVEGDDDFIESSSQSWQASEELITLLNVCFVKSISGFDKRQIVRSCPRPDVDCVYTPTLDKFLPDLIPKCKAEDKAVRKRQDLLSDLAGPLAMIHELLSQTRETTLILSLLPLPSIA